MKETAYVNGYIHLIFRKLGEESENRFVYCAGVNMTRFRPLTWGTHGQFMNPAFRGLQLLRLKFLIPAVQEFGGRVRRPSTTDCGEVPEGEGWFRETFELLDVPEDFPEQILQNSVRYLIEVILKVARPGMPPPQAISDPAQLEKELDHLAASCGSTP